MMKKMNLKIIFSWLRTKLYKIKRNLSNPNYYKFQYWKICYPNVINSQYKKNVSSMFGFTRPIFDWFKDDAQKLIYKYNLSPHSIVVDIGGYTGTWSKEIVDRYNCRIIIYEPVNKYFNQLKHNFLEYNNVTLKNYGLGEENKNIKIERRGVQTSTQNPQNQNYDEIIDIKDVAQEDDLQIIKIDLMSINIEGGEYELLKRMIQSNMVEKIINIQIQFHEWYPSYIESVKLRRLIQDELSKTHNLIFCYPFVWESWQIKT